MKTRSAVPAIVVLAAVLAGPGSCWAAPYETSWIFRSAVAEGQSMWGPGTLTGYSFSDSYLVTTWPFQGTGFTWSLQANQGIVSGNVEGIVTAVYDNYVSGAAKTTVQLSYAGLGGESRIGTSLAASLTATPRFRMAVLPWPFPSIDWSMPVSALNVGVSTATDFTTGLGRTVAASGKYEILPFSLELGLFAGRLNINLDQDILFTPTSITGTVTCTHMATGAVRTAPVTLLTDGAAVPVDLGLDLTGHWDISLNSFSVAENTFHQELGLAAELGFAIPLLGANWSIATDSWFDLYNTTFALDFNNHGHDGDDATPDGLGRFSIYVESTPEPASAWLLGAGLAGLARLRKASRRRKSP